MLAKVYRLWLDGRQIPKWQLYLSTQVQGELRLSEERDDLLNRTMRAASLFDFSKADYEVIPKLHDCAVLWIKGNTMTISGFERTTQGYAYAQTWLVEIVSVEDKHDTKSSTTSEE